MIQIQDVCAALVPEEARGTMSHSRIDGNSERMLQLEICGVLPNVMQENVSHHFGSCYNRALGFVESASIVFNVAHLPY